MKILLTALILFLGSTGCTPTVQIKPPEKPLEINLNVKIDHKIQVKVDKELEDVMDDSDIF